MKLIIILALLFSAHVFTMEHDNYEPDVHEFINQHLYEPEVLRDLLIDMGYWKQPDLQSAERILQMGIKEASANARDKGNIWLDNGGSTALTTAAYFGHLDYVKLLIKYGADIEQRDPWNGHTALIDSACKGKVDVVRYLLDKKANVNAVSGLVSTALMCAAGQGYLEIVTLLLAAGANKSLVDHWGDTALDKAACKHFGTKEDYEEIIKLLS